MKKYRPLPSDNYASGLKITISEFAVATYSSAVIVITAFELAILWFGKAFLKVWSMQVTTSWSWNSSPPRYSCLVRSSKCLSSSAS